MTLKRRDFLKIAAGSSLGFSLSGCSLEQLSESTSKSAWLSAVEHWIPTICQGCTGGCGILVRVIDDRAVKIEGNPFHPLNSGRVCPRGQAGLQLLYNPDRIKTPLKKTGNRESGDWQAVSWEEAIEEVASRLSELRKQGRAHSVAYVGQDLQNTTDDLIARFLEVFGTPNHVNIDEWATIKEVFYHSHGIYDLPVYDFENSKYVLSFGTDFLNNWPTSMANQRAYGAKRASRDLKIIQIEPRFSIVASRADKWVPINPGTEGLLALGLSSVIVKEKLYDEAFINRFAAGFEDWADRDGNKHVGFKNRILREISLDKVSDITGVPLRTIIEIAKEFAANKPAIAVADYSKTFHKEGLSAASAIHSLNALTGSIDVPGGILRQSRSSLGEMPPAKLDATAKRGLSQLRIDGNSRNGQIPKPIRFNAFLDGVLQNKPYRINCLLLSNQNRLANFPITEKVKEALHSIPLIVSFSGVVDETSQFADFILPDSTYFEKWQEYQVSSLHRTPIVGLGRPVVKPIHQTLPMEDVILTLAKKIHPSFSSNFSWNSFKTLLFDRFKGLYHARRGGIFSTSFENTQLRLLEERGWWVPQHESLDDFIKDFQDKGGWHDPSFHFNERSSIYQTPSRKYEFFTASRDPMIPAKYSGDESSYPFILHFYDLPFTSNGSGENLPWHQETLGFRFNLEWRPWVEINPEAAETLKIHDKDSVWVESPFGKIKAMAKIFPGTMPKVLGLPLGKKQDIPGKTATKKYDPLILVGETYNEQSGMISRHSVRAKIYK